MRGNAAPPVIAWITMYWATIAALGVVRDVLLSEGPIHPVALVRIGLTHVLGSSVWGAVTLAVFALTREKTSFGLRDLGVVVLSSLGLAAVVQLTHAFIGCEVVGTPCGSARDRWLMALASFPNSFAVAVNLFALAWTLRSVEISRAHETRTNMARSELFRAQTSALERQLRPHFLFNTMQSVITLMRRDPATARSMLLGLRSLLRHSLESASAVEVPLAEELDSIRDYLRIEALRFAGRLELAIDADPAALDARVPPLLLQPIVENAVHHAVAVRGRGRIEVAARAHVARGQLQITITDTGPGAGGATSAASTGIGLRNARTRLQVLYGSEWRLDLRHSPAGGSEVEVVVPFRTHDM